MTTRADAPSLDVRAGLVAGAAAIGLLVGLLLFELRAAAFLFGIMVAIAADLPGTRPRRVGRIASWLVGGAAVAAIGPFLTVGWVFAAATFLAVAGSFSAATRDRRLGLAAMFVGLVVTLQPALAAPGGAPALLLGGAIAGGLTLLRDRPEDQEAPTNPPDVAATLASATTIAAAAWLGFELFPDHPAWAGLTAVIVLAPTGLDAWAAAGARLLGTIVGAVLSLVTISIIDGMIGLSVVVLLAVALQFAVRPLGYPYVVVFITIAVLAASAIVGDDPLVATGDRVLATALGAGLALVPLTLTRLRASR